MERLLPIRDMFTGEDAAYHPLLFAMDVPPAFFPKAKYTIEALLVPLGIKLDWVSIEIVSSQGGVYYGPHRNDLPEHVLQLAFSREGAAFFERFAPYNLEHLTWQEWEGERWPILFTDNDLHSGDLVASSFFWLSGWQEFSTLEKDQHGRFPFHASLQAKIGTITLPVVDAYREMLAYRLKNHGVSYRRRYWRAHSWAFCPTHDIDYLRKWRPGMIYREVVQYFLSNHLHVPFSRRVKRLKRFVADWTQRGDVYRKALDRMQEEEKLKGATATYFFKSGAHGDYDVSYKLTGKYTRMRIRSLEKDGFEIGLHPSYYAQTHPGYMVEEREALGSVLSRKPVSVRQHYLRFDPLITPVLQESAGFSIDSTLGFAEHEGFRRGTCLPFLLFDPIQNRALDVWEMPLIIMESALFNRRHLDLERALDATEQIIQRCRRFGGACVVLWHNTLWDDLDFPGWGDHFLESLTRAHHQGALITSLRGALESWR